MTQPTTMRRAVSDEDKEQRRRDLLAAAKRLFAERGFSATTIADVARAAGVSYGVVYWYFESKDDLFHALMSEEEAALRDRITGAIDNRAAKTDLRVALREAVQATFEYFDEDRASAALLFRDSFTLSDDFERHLFGIYARFTDEIEGAIRQAQKAGVARPAPAQLVAFSAAALISQMALRRLTTDDGMTASDAAAFTVDLLIDGIA
jgi:AcrR family transcriptional regulator